MVGLDTWGLGSPGTTMTLGACLYDQIRSATVPSKISQSVIEGQEITENLFGKHNIPGGQRTILIEARLQLE
jgi:hypothetical protein